MQFYTVGLEHAAACTGKTITGVEPVDGGTTRFSFSDGTTLLIYAKPEWGASVGADLVFSDARPSMMEGASNE
jgi:hypothetical protein